MRNFLLNSLIIIAGLSFLSGCSVREMNTSQLEKCANSSLILKRAVDCTEELEQRNEHVAFQSTNESS